MVKFKLIKKLCGTGKTSGKPYCCITLGFDKDAETRITAEFWCSQSVANKVKAIPLDSLVYVSAEVDADLHYNISDIRLADSVKA